jgi:hypothetical protein
VVPTIDCGVVIDVTLASDPARGLNGGTPSLWKNWFLRDLPAWPGFDAELPMSIRTWEPEIRFSVSTQKIG